jgi:hypothetical protein
MPVAPPARLITAPGRRSRIVSRSIGMRKALPLDLPTGTSGCKVRSRRMYTACGFPRRACGLRTVEKSCRHGAAARRLVKKIGIAGWCERQPGETMGVDLKVLAS